MAVSIGKLIHIITVDRKGSFTLAAQSLNVTQSAITKSVNEAETELNLKIFERHTRKVITTETGRVFIDRAARVVGDFDQLLLDARTQGRASERIVRIGVSPPSAGGLISQSITSFVKKNTGVYLHVQSSAIETGLRQLRQGDVELLFGDYHQLSASKDIDVRKLGTLSAKLFARNGHPLSGQEIVGNDQLALYPIIAPDPFNPAFRQLTGRLPKKGVDPLRSMHIFENFGIEKSVVSNSDSIAIVSESYSKTRSFQEKFDIIDPEFTMYFEISYATAQGRDLNLMVRKFISALSITPLS